MASFDCFSFRELQLLYEITQAVKYQIMFITDWQKKKKHTILLILLTSKEK